MDGKVQWLETSDNKPLQSQMMNVSFGIEIASMHGAVVEKNMRHQMQADRQTKSFHLNIYDIC